MNQPLIDQWTASRRSGEPLILINTPDQPETLASLVEIETKRLGDEPIAWRWDISRGMEPVTDAGAKALGEIIPKPASPSAGGSVKALTKQPADAMAIAYKLAELAAGDEPRFPQAIVFVLNAQLYMANEASTQAIANLRDAFKQTGATLVMLAPWCKLPPHLIDDVAVFTEDRPTADDLRRILLTTHTAANEERKKKRRALIPKLEEETIVRAVGALSGLAAFPAENAVAVNLEDKGINVTGLWQRKMAGIDQMPGVTVWRGSERYEDLLGQDNVQTYSRKLLAGRDAPTVIGIFDEWDKNSPGQGSGDLSGISQELYGYFLTEMHNNDYPGMILIGPGGSGKTEFLKATANAAIGGKVLPLMINFAGMKSSLVGSSMANLVQFFTLLKAISGGRALFGFTCNKFNFDAAFQRRCYLGQYFFDLPEKKVVDGLWAHYMRKYELLAQELPESIGWTGAEVRACSMMSYRLREPLVESAKRIIPVAVSAAEEIDTLRRASHNNFISAYREGPYQYTEMIKNIRPRGRFIDGSATQN